MDKVIFWDFDGTLVHVGPRYIDFFDFALKQYGYTLDRSQMLEHLKSASPWYNLDKPHPNQVDKWWDRFLEGLNEFYSLNNVDKTHRQKINTIFKQKMATENTYVLYDDAKDVLQKCIEKGYKNYLLTNNYPELDVFVKYLGIEQYFSGLVISAYVGYEKPRKEIFEYAKKQANCDSGLMVGDNLHADILGGKNAGLKTVLVHNQCESQADCVCETLTDILKII